MALNIKKIHLDIYLWLLVLLSIPLISIFGRSIQHYVVENYSKQNVAIAIGTILVLMCVNATYWLVKHHTYNRLWHLLWFIPLFIIFPYNMPVIEERFHFVIFGLFGYLNARLFSIKTALAVCIGISVSDEVLQWYLPDRVGDWHDVGINLVASIAGAVFSYISMKKD